MARQFASVQSAATTETMTLIDNATGESIVLPVLIGSDDTRALDIRGLYGRTGLLTFDPGFTSTASCDSEITYIDGERGILLYRGYAIEDLAEHSDFMEVCYLLLYGELPTQVQKAEFVRAITQPWRGLSVGWRNGRR